MYGYSRFPGDGQTRLGLEVRQRLRRETETRKRQRQRPTGPDLSYLPTLWALGSLSRSAGEGQGEGLVRSYRTPRTALTLALSQRERGKRAGLLTKRFKL
jgi:hypothetical protein